MTIKISQLANITVTQANTIVPVVSNITGTLTTVQANVQQLQTYMLENAGNLIPAAGNIYSIGNSTTWWKDLWLSANTLYIGGVPMGVSSGSLTFGGNVVGTSDLPTYTGPVSANAVSVGATTVFGNITTLPTMSIDGDTGNVTASDISTTGSLLTGGDITTTGDISTTGAVTTGDVSFALSPAGAVTVLGSGGFSGTLYTPGRIYETTTDGAGSGLRVLVTYVEYGPGSARSLPSPSGGTIKIIDGGSGYSDGDAVYIQHYGDEVGGITAILQAQSVTGAPVTSGTITANTSVWSFDESGDTTVPGNISLPDNTAIYNEDASTAVFTSNSVSDATSIYLTDAGNAAVYASDSVVLETNSDGNVTQQWSFNADGSVTFPVGATLRDGNAGQIVFGASAGRVSQGASAVAIGGSAGEYNQGAGATSIGYTAGFNNQGYGTTAVGYNAGRLSQGNAAIAVGFDSGVDSQGLAAIAIGNNSGRKNQKDFSISIGYYAGNTSQGNNSVSIGYGAGYENQKLNAISIGKFAGYNLQGLNSIAIGENAGYSAQANNSIIINATGSELNLTTANAFVVAPVRTDSANVSNSMYYNTSTKEITYTSSSAFLPTYSGNIADLTVSGNIAVVGNTRINNSYVPAFANSTGVAGQIVWDSSYIYVCVGTDTWKRANVSTW